MDLLQFKNTETAKIMTLDSKLKVLSSDGREIFIQDSAIFALLYYLFTSKETVISYSIIGCIIKEKKSTSHMEDCSNNIIANKYIFKTRSILKGLMIEDFIITVRGLGYKISNKWLTIPGDDHINYKDSNFLNEIDLIIDNCIKYSESTHIIQDKSGLCFIKPDYDVVIDHFNRMNSCYHSFLSRYSAPGNSIELIQLREKITKLLLYAIYWRAGDSMSNEKFRADYKNELLVLSKQIKQAVILLD